MDRTYVGTVKVNHIAETYYTRVHSCLIHRIKLNQDQRREILQNVLLLCWTSKD